MAKRVNKAKMKRLLLFVDVLLVGVLLVSGTLLAVAVIRYERDRAIYREAQQLAVSAPADAASPAPAAPTALPAGDAPAGEWAPPAEKPPITVDFAAIRAEGEDVCGWLYSDGTVINYPVVRYTNNTYYLTHAYDGTRSDGGALFVDARCAKELGDQNIIVYGHHMKNKTMFGSLLEYQKQTYYDAHPVLYLLTPTQNYRVEVFAAWFSDSETEHFPVYFASDAARRQFVLNAMNASGFTAAAEYRSSAQMLTLVTCAYTEYFDDAKFQVNGWLIPIG